MMNMAIPDWVRKAYQDLTLNRAQTNRRQDIDESTNTRQNTNNGTHRRVLWNSVHEFYAAIQPFVPHLMIRHVLQGALVSPSPHKKRRH
jgi:hypothetical protein